MLIMERRNYYQAFTLEWRDAEEEENDGEGEEGEDLEEENSHSSS